MKKKLLQCMTVMTALLFVSCSSEFALEGGSPDNVVTGEEVEVTFSISAKGTQMQTRVGGPGRYQTIVGKGTEIDMLIYAVYEKDDKTGKYTLLKQYGKGIVVDEKHEDFVIGGTEEAPEYAPAIAAKKQQENETKEDGTLDKYDGQTILNLGDRFKNEETAVEEITLRLMRNKEYHIAFWAQSSKTRAFKTNDLENVQVIYDDAENNDELRDAFCKVESFSVSPSTAARTVILTRPMAQINVGTSGADYKRLLKGGTVYPNDAVTKSQIRLTGVSNKINVVTDEINAAIDEPVTFEWRPLAAYIKNGYEIPTKEDELLKVEGEEFLRVDLNHDRKIYRYKTSYPTLDKNGDPLTETFKYLSMCYALVPAPAASTDKGTEGGDENNGDYQLPDAYSSSVLTQVEVFFAGGNADDEVNASDKATMTLQNVPVHRNWRTNIIGGLYYMKDPDDPDDPGYPKDNDPDDPKDPDNPDPDNPDDPDIPTSPDPTSVFNYKNTRIYLDNMFYNEHNGYRDDYNKEDDSYGFDEKLNPEDKDSDSNGSENGDDEENGGDDGEGEKGE